MKAMIFIDGKNFHSGWKENSADRRVDFTKLSHWLTEYVDCEDFQGAHYYTGVAEEGGSLDAFLDMLDHQPGFFVHRFPRRLRNLTCMGCDTDLAYSVEKEVDTSLTADILRFAALGAYDVAVLVSGDGDLVPAVNGGHELGKKVFVATFQGFGLSGRLRKAAFDHIDLMDGVEAFSVERDADDSYDDYDDYEEEEDDHVRASLLDMDPEEILYHEVIRAEEKFEGGFVGLSYFLNRWIGDGLPRMPERRREMVNQLVDEGRLEIYKAGSGDLAVRSVS